MDYIYSHVLSTVKLGFEHSVHFVYTLLLQLSGERQHVLKRSKVIGRSGASHEIDVFYEFERAGVPHRVAIECKDTGRPVTKGQVQEFYAKVIDLQNVVPIVVSRHGFQEGAKQYADHYDIHLLGWSELPQLDNLLTKWLEFILMPGRNDIGEPFWALIDPTDRIITHTYYCLSQRGLDGTLQIPLFISKRHAQYALKHLEKNSRYEVRGISQRVLKTILPFIARYGGSFVCFYSIPEDGSQRWFGFPKSPEEIATDFVIDGSELVVRFIRRK